MNSATKAVSNGFCKTVFQPKRVCSKNEGRKENKDVICRSRAVHIGKNSALGLEYGQEASA